MMMIVFAYRLLQPSTGNRITLCCSGVSAFQTARGIVSTSLLLSTYQRRTYRKLARARGVLVVLGEPRCTAQGWRIRTSPISSGTGCIGSVRRSGSSDKPEDAARTHLAKHRLRKA